MIASDFVALAGRVGLTLALSILGGFAMNAAGVPAGWLMGGAVVVSIAALMGAPVVMPIWLRNVTYVLIGMSMGASVPRNSLELIAQWPITMAALAIELIIIIATTGYMLQRVFGLDRGTAYLSSFPGHLSFVMGIASAGVGDSRQITIIQIIRILMLTICIPMLALFLPEAHFTAPPAPAPMGLVMLVLYGLACAMVGWIFHRLKAPAGFVLGAMACGMVAKLNGFIDGSLPEPVVLAGFILVGALIGARFAGITAREFARAAIGGLIATGMTVGIVTAITLIVSLFVDMPFTQLWLGLSPGALEGMGALGVALGLDTAFIAAHHVSRLLMLTIAIPLVTYMVRERPN